MRWRAQRFDEAEGILKMGQVQAAQDINEEYREELQAVSAKNILRRVDVHLALALHAQRGLRRSWRQAPSANALQ